MLFCHSRKQQNICGYENKNYYVCKRERDAILFTRIKDWETGLAKANTKESLTKIEELEAKRAGLSLKFEKVPASLGNKHKRWRMAADIEQLKWRIDYLKEACELADVKKMIERNQ